MTTMLITSAGRRVELLQCFRADAGRLDLPLRILAADLQPMQSAACQVADSWLAVPRCTDAAYVPALLEICRREGVRLLVPTIDTELAVLAGHREMFAQVGTMVAVSDPAVIGVARDKLRTSEVFGAAGVTVPRTAPLAELLAEPRSWRWPVILKPVGGSSSVGLQVAETPEDARRLGAARSDYLAQEFWRGREFTVNMFFPSQGTLACTVAHWRIETRGGEVSKGRTERVPVLAAAAARIAAALPGARGALCFQAILTDDGRAGVFEINARFGGGFPLVHRAGARFSQWLLEEALGQPSSANDDWKAGVTMLRYDAAVYIDE